MIDTKITYVTIAIVVSLGLLTAIPPIIPERVVEPFSEIGILGPNMKLGDYPSNLAVGESFVLYLYLGNQEGHVTYYRTLVKLGSQDTNVSDTEPMNVPAIGYYDIILSDEQNSTIPITLSIDNEGVNQRLVFELNKYDSDKNSFTYSGQWLQMWLNITSTT